METRIQSHQERKFAFFGIGLLFAILFLSPLKWLALSIQAPEYRLHSILLVGFSGFLVFKSRQQKFRFENFQVRTLPFILFMIGVYGFSTTEMFWNIDVLSCAFLGLTLYGFSGFVSEPEKWKNSAVYVLLFFICLPLSYHIETFAGFPMRVACARAAERFFTLFYHNVYSTETILMVENKFAHVDLPCSGLKSLWSITLFCLILSAIEKFRVNSRWVISIVMALFIVAAANILRIIALVLIHNSSLPQIAKDSLHSPIGLLGFLISCVVTYWIFQKLCIKRSVDKNPPPKQFQNQSLAAIAIILISAIGIIKVRMPIANATARPQAIKVLSEGLPLTLKESDLFLRHDVIAYEKQKIKMADIRGTSFLVLAKNWRGHHHPEQCLQGQGASIKSSEMFFINKKFLVRRVTLNNWNSQIIYWFQSLEGSTDDYASRVWDGILNPNKDYVMVSLYIENGALLNPDDIKNLVNSYYKTAHVLLEQGVLNEK